jgi:hypothetical protein
VPSCRACAPGGDAAVHHGRVVGPSLIEPGGGEADPDALADRYFELYERRDQPEIKVGNYIAQALAAAPN